MHNLPPPTRVIELSSKISCQRELKSKTWRSKFTSSSHDADLRMKKLGQLRQELIDARWLSRRDYDKFCFAHISPAHFGLEHPRAHAEWHNRPHPPVIPRWHHAFLIRPIRFLTGWVYSLFNMNYGRCFRRSDSMSDCRQALLK